MNTDGCQISTMWTLNLKAILTPSTEHAYQAAKTLDEKERASIRKLEKPSEAKKAGMKVTLRPDWESIKLDIMYELNLKKFLTSPELRKDLIATGTMELEEGNSWGDRYWGKVDGKGENHLGKILMKIRCVINDSTE